MRRLADRVKRRQFFTYIREKQIDIICVQETHCQKKYHKIWRSEWGGEIYYCDGESNARGVMIMFRKGLTSQDVKFKQGNEGRTLRVYITHEEKVMHIINVYAPNQDNDSFFLELCEQLQHDDSDFCVLMGDLNKCLNLEIDRKGGHPKDMKSSLVINNFLEESNWFDLWRILNPDKFGFTWKQKNPLILSRLDYILIPSGMIGHVQDCQIWPSYLSDHSFMYLQLDFNNQIRGRGFWKFNTKLLEDLEYAKEVNKIIEMADWRYEDLDPGLKWESVKNDVREFSIWYAKERALKRKIEIQNLERQLKSAHKRLGFINLKSATAVHFIQKINQINAELLKYSLVSVQGQILRAKARYVSQGEYSTKYFFNLEKRNAQAKVMNKIKTDCGSLIRKPKDILQEQSKFYQKLHTKNEQIHCEIKVTPEKKLTIEEKSDLEKPITIQEMGDVIKQMALNKSPGTDGFQVNFYICFFTRIKQMLFGALEFALKVKKIHPSGRDGIITLLPKEGKNSEYLKNWRPITLLNTDYKILSKIIAT